MQVPNGMSWDLKKKVMYYNDTPYQTCTAYATDEDGVPIKCAAACRVIMQALAALWLCWLHAW